MTYEKSGKIAFLNKTKQIFRSTFQNDPYKRWRRPSPSGCLTSLKRWLRAIPVPSSNDFREKPMATQKPVWRPGPEARLMNLVWRVVIFFFRQYNRDNARWKYGSQKQIQTPQTNYTKLMSLIKFLATLTRTEPINFVSWELSKRLNLGNTNKLY